MPLLAAVNHDNYKTLHRTETDAGLHEGYQPVLTVKVECQGEI